MSQQILKLNLEDLEPATASFKLSTFPEHTFKLKPYTLRVQLWAQKTFKKDILQDAVFKQDIELLTELAFYILSDEDKKILPTTEAMQDAVVSFKDRSALINAILETMGFSQPVVEKLTDQLNKQLEAQKNAGKSQDPSLSTGESSTT